MYLKVVNLKENITCKRFRTILISGQVILSIQKYNCPKFLNLEETLEIIVSFMDLMEPTVIETMLEEVTS